MFDSRTWDAASGMPVVEYGTPYILPKLLFNTVDR